MSNDAIKLIAGEPTRGWLDVYVASHKAKGEPWPYERTAQYWQKAGRAAADARSKSKHPNVSEHFSTIIQFAMAARTGELPASWIDRGPTFEHRVTCTALDSLGSGWPMGAVQISCCVRRRERDDEGVGLWVEYIRVTHHRLHTPMTDGNIAVALLPRAVIRLSALYVARAPVMAHVNMVCRLVGLKSYLWWDKGVKAIWALDGTLHWGSLLSRDDLVVSRSGVVARSHSHVAKTADNDDAF